MKEGISYIVEDVKKDRKFVGVDEHFIIRLIEYFFTIDNKLLVLIKNNEYESYKNKRLYKYFIKAIRKVLYDLYAVYQTKDAGKRSKILVLMKEIKNKERLLDLYKEILSCHTSSRERIDYYREIYEKIFSVCQKHDIIIDFGCGLNPFSIPFMKIKNFEYIACEFNKKDVTFVQDYFNYFSNLYQFKGKSLLIDIFEEHFDEKIKKLLKVDICFLFKMTDVFDYFGGHKQTEKFIKNVKANYIVVSFPTKTVSGKKMNAPRRGWFETMIKRLGYDFSYFEIPNEIFYIVKCIVASAGVELNKKLSFAPFYQT